MERVLAFALNHPILVGTFLALLVLLVLLERRRAGQTVSPQELTNLVNQSTGVIVDVRERKEFREGHITGSRNIPYNGLKDHLVELGTFKDKPVVLVCKIGQTAGAAGKTLHLAGFKDVKRLRGGISAWTADGLPLVKGK